MGKCNFVRGVLREKRPLENGMSAGLLKNCHNALLSVFRKLDSSNSDSEKKSQAIIERERGFQLMRQRNMIKKAK
jgi:hypothetical protein